jgi:hypothetical protein
MNPLSEQNPESVAQAWLEEHGDYLLNYANARVREFLIFRIARI